MFTEINIDGLVGPTHHFGGLGVGNVASIAHQDQISHPRQAALEGLQKAWLIASLGTPQFIVLPPLRPRFELLTDLGFEGSVQEQMTAARQAAPRALSAAFSSAFMWLANAATVTAAADSADGNLHCTPANLISSWHRASEAVERTPQLLTLLAGIEHKRIHRPLPSVWPLRDEGAANHMRLCDSSGQQGFNLFVYGADDNSEMQQSTKFSPRHTLAASQAIARLHRLRSDQTFFLHQHPRAIDAGVFHNDVIATSCDHLLLHHDLAFVESETELHRLQFEFQRQCHTPLQRIAISESELPLTDAVKSYFFNSQLIKTDTAQPGEPVCGSRYLLVCPHLCQEIPAATKLVQRLLADSAVPIDEVRYVRLPESMAKRWRPSLFKTADDA